MPKKILIAGYYGCGNAGDDMLLAALTMRLKNYPFEITALSNNPIQTEKFCGIKTFKRMHLKSILKAIKKCDVLVFGGGSIFQDSTSIRSMFYYYSLICSAKFLRKKIFLLGQGVGPINSWIGRKVLKHALHLIDWMFVRDEKSYGLCRSLCSTLKIDLGADLAFLFPTFPLLTPKLKTVGISLRPHYEEIKTLNIAKEILKLVLDKGYTPCWWIMHPEMDEPIINKIDPTGKYKRLLLNENQSPQDFLKEIAKSSYAITMRLHAGIFALLTNTNPLAISYDPKVSAFAEQNSLECWNMNQEKDLKNLWEKTWIKKNVSIENSQLLVEKQFDKFIRLLES